MRFTRLMGLSGEVLGMALVGQLVLAEGLVGVLNWAAPAYWAPPGAAERETAGSHPASVAAPESVAPQALPTGPLPFVGITPCRAADTRDGSLPPGYGPPFMPGSVARDFTLWGRCGIPSTAQAVSFNFAVTNTTGPGFLFVYPQGAAPPTVSTLNYLAGQTIANAAVVPLGATGAITAVPGVSGFDLIIDVNGYYAPQTVVNTLNTLSGAVGLAAGSNVTITPSGQTLTIASTGSGGGTITGVTAGTGLTGGGTSGSVTVGIAAAGVGTTQLAEGAVTDPKVANGISYGKLSGAPASLPPSGAAGGALASTYPNPTLANDAVLAGSIAAGQVVKSLNGLFDGVTLVSGSDVAVTPSGQTLTIATNSASANTPNTLVRRDGSGNFSAGRATLAGNLALPNSASASTGVITLGGNRFAHNFGSNNTFLGGNAGNFTMTGSFNTASGRFALPANTTGSSNTASGDTALYSNTIGAGNTASGDSVLYSNTIGDHNTASGYQALYSNTTGNFNMASGDGALLLNTSGSGNIGVGHNTGSNLTTGNDNIDIGNSGIAAESATIRIGTSGTQTKAFIAGINGVTTGGPAVAVLIDGDGQLGTVSSSRRYKFDIADMGAKTDGLMHLRPVTFRYVQHGGNGPIQFGLIAEEVAEVYPELVVRNKDGEVETVMYQFLAPMLLNEIQKLTRRLDELSAELARLRETVPGGRHSESVLGSKGNR